VSFRITTNGKHAHGLGGLPVAFRYPGQKVQRVYTNGSGRATAYVTAKAGLAKVTATVRQVPEWRLWLRDPAHHGPSQVVVGGRRAILTSAKNVRGLTGQAVTVAPTSSTTTVGDTLDGSFTIAGGTGTRTVTVTLYGPTSKSTGTSTSCGGTAAYSYTTTSAGGIQDLQPFTPTKVGYYQWKVSAAANTATTAASGCSTPIDVAKASQSVTVDPAASTSIVGSQLTGTYTLAGGVGSRTVTRSVYGPYASSSTWCTGKPIHTSSLTVKGSVSTPRTLGSWKPAKSGYYRWKVILGANAASKAGAACSAPIRVRTTAHVSQYRVNDTKTVHLGGGFRVGVKITGFDRSENHTISSRLYGPFTSQDKAVCTPGKLLGNHTQNNVVTTNGSIEMTPTSVSNKAKTGWYVWESSLTSGALIVGDTSSCGIAFNVVR
jgi:hypothetical protein